MMTARILLYLTALPHANSFFSDAEVADVFYKVSTIHHTAYCLAGHQLPSTEHRIFCCKTGGFLVEG